MSVRPTIDDLLLFFRCANPGLFLIYFRSFQANNTIFTTNQCEKCPSSIWYRDLKPRPLKHESSPITTRPLDFILFVRAQIIPKVAQKVATAA